jgi:hypothetical protein
MIKLLAALMLAASLAVPALARAATPFRPPQVPAADVGAVVSRVQIDTYGVVDPTVVAHYLALHEGDRINQQAVDHDFTNLIRLGQFQPRLEIHAGSAPHTVALRWIIQNKVLRPTTHPYYGDAPLSAPIQGAGWILTSPPLNSYGGYFSSYTQFSRRANLARVLYTQPLTFNPATGQQSSLVVDDFGGRGVFRASEPKAINVFSWTTGQEALWLDQATNGTQIESGIRIQRSSDELPSAIVATSVYSTYEHPAYNTELVAGVSHACLVPYTRWFPPMCSQQYRFSVTDAIGGLGASTRFRVYNGDYVHYFSVGDSTLAIHGQMARSSGVLPDSFLVCAVAKSYPKSFCGTDEQNVQAEFRLDDHDNRPFQLVLFTEEASSRVRGSEVPYATPYFSWWPDSGVGFVYRALRIDVSYGKDGGRIFGGLRGTIF